MRKINAVIGQVPETFSQRRKVPKLPLVVIAVLIGLGGAYAVIHSLAATNTGLLFDGEQISNYQNQSAPGAVTEVPDPAGSGQQVFKMVVKNTDVAPVTPTNNPRAQLVSPNTLTNGEDFWWSSKVYLPSDFPDSIPSGGWFNLLEGAYGPPFNGSPAWQFEIMGNQFGWQRNGTYNWDIPYLGPQIVKNQWVSVMVHEKLASDGFIEMWVNGQPITFFPSGSSNYNPNHVSPTTHLSMQTLDSSNNGGNNFVVLQSYRQVNMFDTVTLYEWPMKIGTTEASVSNGTATAPISAPVDTTPPTVSVTSPTTGSTVSGQVSLAANASDDTGVSKVEFYVDGTLVGTSTSAPYAVTWNAANVVAGAHTITAKAYDAAGNVGTSSAVTVNTAAAPTASQLILDAGGFESGTLNNWNTSGAGDAVPVVVSDTARSGSKSAKFSLTGTQTRSELILGGNGTASTTGMEQFKEGDDYYYAFSFYIDQMDYGYPGAHNVIFQLKGNDQQSPDLALQLWDSSGAASDGSPGGKGLWYSGAAAGSDRFLAPVSEQQWHDVVVHFKVSNQNAGADQIYLDGKLLRSDVNVNTMQTDTSNVYIKNGIYRGSLLTGNSAIYLDDAKLGTSYSAVAETTPLPASGSTSGSGGGTPAPDTTNPTVSITSPANGSTVSGIVTSTASASDNVGVSRVEFYLDNASTPVMTDTASPYNYSFDSKTLGNGSHTIVAKAYDAAGNSSSASSTFTVNNPDTTPPSAPANLTATAPNATTVNLTWNASTDSGPNATGVATYNVLRNGVVIAQTTTTSYADNTTVASTGYSYAVQAVDGAGNVSANSNTATVTTPSGATADLLFNGTKISDFLVQAAPNAITQVADPLGSGQQVFKYVVNNSDVAPITPTDNPRAQLVGPGNINVGDDVWLENKFLLPSDFPSTVPGWMALFATYGSPFDGSGAWGVEVSGNQIQWQRNDTYNWDVPWSIPLVKNQWMTILVHEKFDTNGFIEMWVNGQPVTFFDRNSTNYYNPNNVAATTHLTMQTADHSEGQGPDSGRVMEYRLVNMFDTVTTYHGPLVEGKTQAAVEAAFAADAGNSPPTPGAPTPDTTPPTTPANLTATAANATQVNLTWSASTDSGGSGIAGYNVYRNGTRLNSALITTTSYGDSTVSPSTTYTYTVEAVDGAGNKSPQTSGAAVTTPAPPDTTPPTTPANLTATAANATQVNLTWSASTDSGGSGIAGYNVYRNGTRLNSAPVSGTAYSDTSVAANQTYQYAIQAVDNAGNLSNMTSAVSVTTPQTSGGSSSGNGSTVPLSIIVTSHRQPVVGATVTIGSQTAQTNSQGVAQFSNVPVGTQTVTIQTSQQTVTKSISVLSNPRHHASSQYVQVSLTGATLSPLLLLVPVVALLVGGLLVLRPWNGRFEPAAAKDTVAGVVSSSQPKTPVNQPGRKLEAPGTVYKPGDHGDSPE